MEKHIINVPEVEHLSDFTEFDSLLDRGKVIVDKEVCGCGATEYYLRLPDVPVLLLSPRKLLIETKLDGNPSSEEQLSENYAPYHRRYKAFYFNRSKGKIQDSISELVLYLQNEDMLPWFTPKILVTYDSFSLVLETLQRMGILKQFTIVIDEFNALFTDVKLKGTKELQTLGLLDSLPNHIVYLSATPIKEQFLSAIPAFANLPYYELKWPQSIIQQVRVKTEPMKNAVAKTAEIISEFRQRGYFKSTFVNGKEIFSREAVFFINSVNTIVNIIKKCGLSPDETLILCADESDNFRKLSALSPSFTIGKPSSEATYKKDNKPFTLVTRVCFEGADLYSDYSSTYVFSDCHLDNLNLDLSTDLPQIAGRCRTKSNPFRNEIRLYYKTSDRLLIKRTKEAIAKREQTTAQMLKSLQGISDAQALQVIEDAQRSMKYKKYYLDVETDPTTGTARAVVNELARQADLRALDIKEEQYKSGYSVAIFSHDNNRQFATTDDYALDNLWHQFATCNDFAWLMQQYIVTIEQYPHLKEIIENTLTEIPAEYKIYYNSLGPDVIRALGYKRSEIDNYIASQSNIITCQSHIQARLYDLLQPGNCYSNSEVKQALATVNAEFGIQENPTATDIMRYLNAQPCKFTDNNHKRKNGYRIL